MFVLGMNFRDGQTIRQCQGSKYKPWQVHVMVPPWPESIMLFAWEDGQQWGRLLPCFGGFLGALG